MCDECTWHHKGIPRAISVLTLGNKVILYCILLSICSVSSTPDEDHESKALVFLIVLYESSS